MILSVVAGVIWRPPAVVLSEVRRQPNAVEGPRVVMHHKNAKGMFRREPEWIHNEGWS